MDAFDRAAEREARARRERRAKPVWKRFGIHMRIYGMVNATLFALWTVIATLTRYDTPWFLLPLIGWGSGVLFHYFLVTQITGQWKPAKRQADVSHKRGGK